MNPGSPLQDRVFSVCDAPSPARSVPLPPLLTMATPTCLFGSGAFSTLQQKKGA